MWVVWFVILQHSRSFLLTSVLPEALEQLKQNSRTFLMVSFLYLRRNSIKTTRELGSLVPMVPFSSTSFYSLTQECMSINMEP